MTPEQRAARKKRQEASLRSWREATGRPTGPNARMVTSPWEMAAINTDVQERGSDAIDSALMFLGGHYMPHQTPTLKEPTYNAAYVESVTLNGGVWLQNLSGHDTEPKVARLVPVKAAATQPTSSPSTRP